MPTLLERIETCRTNENLSAVEKINKLSNIKFSKKNYDAHQAVIKAMMDVVPDLKYRGNHEFDNASQRATYLVAGTIERFAQNHEKETKNAITELQKLKIEYEKKAPIYLKEKEFHILRTIVSLANNSDRPGIAAFAAQAIAKTVHKSYKDSVREIEHLRTFSQDVSGLIGVLEHLSNDFKDDHKNSSYRDWNYSNHHRTNSALAAIAKAGRHPEHVNDVFKALQRIGTDSAAACIVDLINNHHSFSIPERPDGKVGNLPHNTRPADIELNSKGLNALTAIGDDAVKAISHLPITNETIDALVVINTESSLKLIAEGMLIAPDFEKYGVENLQCLKTPLAAQALVHFGAAHRHGVSEAYSSRANVAFSAIKSMHWSISNWRMDSPDRTAKLEGLHKAATQLALAITSEQCLKNRFITGDRTQYSIGRNTSHMTGLESDPLIKAETSRTPVKRKRKDIKSELRGLKHMFKNAMKEGLLSKNDPSLETLKTFAKYDKAQRERAKFSKKAAPVSKAIYN